MNVARAGVGLMIVKDGLVLLGKRNDDPEKADSALHGEGTWTMPGGKVDFHDTIIKTAIKELKEETDIDIEKEDLSLLCVQDNMVPDAHFVTVGFLITDISSEPEVMEPDEITEWKWFDFNNLPEKVYPPSQKMILAYLEGKDIEI